jgi:hypothetical protein
MWRVCFPHFDARGASLAFGLDLNAQDRASVRCALARDADAHNRTVTMRLLATTRLGAPIALAYCFAHDGLPCGEASVACSMSLRREKLSLCWNFKKLRSDRD